MSVQRFKIALNNARVPLVSTKAQRATFVPGLDTAQRTPRTFTGSEASADYNTAQIIYSENVMPVSEGVASAGYFQQIAATVNTDFDSAFALRDADENTVLYSPAGGQNYIYDTTAGAWTVNPLTTLVTTYFATAPEQWEFVPGTEVSSKLVTYAYVDGKTFICYPNIKQRFVKLRGDLVDSASTNLTIVMTPTTDGVAGATETFVLGTDPELTVTSGVWTLDLDAYMDSYSQYTSFSFAITEVTPAVVTHNSTRTLASNVTNGSIYYWTGTEIIPATSLVINLPLQPDSVSGISSANGYLIVYGELEVCWAPFNGTAFNFQPFANGNFTGAGSQIPEDLLGDIRAVIPVSGGFAVFTDRNAVAANYHAQNTVSPWVFREIPDAGGLESYEQATVEGSLGRVYAYTTAGFQMISLNSAEPVFVEVSDFIAGRNIERYNFESQELRSGSLSLDMYVKVTNVGNRYVVVSYGTFPKIYSFALVYDRFLERWGKLRHVHRDCFYYAYGTIAAPLTYAAVGDIPYDSPLLTTYDATIGQSNLFVAAPHGLAFLEDTGKVVIANWSEESRTEQDEAVIILGRVQISRSANVQINRVEVDGLKSGSVYIQPSYDGRTLEASIPTVDCGSSEDYAVKGCLVECKNFSIPIQGTFRISAVIVEAMPTGKM